MTDDVLAFLRELEPRTWRLAAWRRERVRAADPDLAERVYRGWKGLGFRHPEAGYVCAVFPRTDWAVLLFEHGAALSTRRALCSATARRRASSASTETTTRRPP